LNPTRQNTSLDNCERDALLWIFVSLRKDSFSYLLNHSPNYFTGSHQCRERSLCVCVREIFADKLEIHSFVGSLRKKQHHHQHKTNCGGFPCVQDITLSQLKLESASKTDIINNVIVKKHQRTSSVCRMVRLYSVYIRQRTKTSYLSKVLNTYIGNLFSSRAWTQTMTAWFMKLQKKSTHTVNFMYAFIPTFLLHLTRY
jgi:hypothetical protein